MNTEYKPRFSFEISEEQKDRANRLLYKHGLRKAVFSVILDDILDIIEDCGELALGVIIFGKCKPREVIPSMKNASEIVEKLGD